MKIDIPKEYKDEVEKLIKNLDKKKEEQKYRDAFERTRYAYHMMLHDSEYQEKKKELDASYLKKYRLQYDKNHES